MSDTDKIEFGGKFVLYSAVLVVMYLYFSKDLLMKLGKQIYYLVTELEMSFGRKMDTYKLWTARRTSQVLKQLSEGGEHVGTTMKRKSRLSGQVMKGQKSENLTAIGQVMRGQKSENLTVTGQAKRKER